MTLLIAHPLASSLSWISFCVFPCYNVSYSFFINNFLALRMNIFKENIHKYHKYQPHITGQHFTQSDISKISD